MRNHQTYEDVIVGEVRHFPLRVVLTVTTGRLLTEHKGPDDNGIQDLYEILQHMTGDSVWTHQLGRFGDECRPWLLRWYPSLNIIDEGDWLIELDRRMKHSGLAAGIESWLAELEGHLGSTFDIGRIPKDDHEKKHPYDELVAMRGTDEGIILVETPD